MDVVRHIVIFCAAFWTAFWVARSYRVVRQRMRASAQLQKWHWDGQHLRSVAPEDDPEWVAWSRKQGSTGS